MKRCSGMRVSARAMSIDIVALDKQADGGTDVGSTGEIGRFEVGTTESKRKGNKRLHIRVHDAETR
jgi:misacylated tRNA(Ala) deacylase